MASSSVMADFGRMPTGRKVMVFAVAGLLLGGLYYRFVYAGLGEEVAEAKGAYEAAARQHAAAVSDLERFGKLRPEMDDLLGELARDQAALPTEAEVPAFFETLQRKVKESGVEIAKWQKRAEEPIESFVKVPVEVEISGTFIQIKRFFASLVQKDLGPAETEERERIVSIESLVISQPQVRNRELILTAKFTAVTFRQDEKAPPGKGGAAGATRPAPAPLRPKDAEPP
ncbi:MAG TPA: type 4a pilus biogenesis protein PilO, partial [Kofleriaceae bacterium]|nr:type 4a pilus biogenesis protein PilO [Kofleriaceae bacterium]